MLARRTPAANETIARRPSLSDSVSEAIRELILTDQVSPGSRLNIDSMAVRLGVSPTPVREALARLEAERLVSKEPLKGYFVTPLLDSRALDQLYELRGVLEPLAAFHAASRAGRQRLDRLERVLSDMERLAAATSGAMLDARASARYFELESAFHEQIIDAADNEFLGEILSRLRGHLHVARRYYRQSVSNDLVRTAVAAHRAVFEAIRSGSAPDAAAAMGRHIARARSRLGHLADETSSTPPARKKR